MNNFRDFIDIVAQAEDAACQQECLRYVEQKPVGYILNFNHLIGYHRYAREYQRHCADILNCLWSIHYSNVSAPHPPRMAAIT